MSNSLSRRAAASFALSLSLSLLAPQSQIAAAESVAPAPPIAPDAPTPTGHRPIGGRTLHLVDSGRHDPWHPQPPGPRELMVSVRYPALSARGPKAPYASETLSTALFGDPAPARLGTHTIPDAWPAPGARPLLLLSPGFGASRVTLTALAEDLASRGYVVAAVDHTHETAVEFPDGRIEPCLPGASRDCPSILDTRSADLRFVLDRLTGPDTGLFVDRARIGVAGHSIGGTSAIRTMRDDPRITAAANLDGSFHTESYSDSDSDTDAPGTGTSPGRAPAPGPELDRPVLLLGTRQLPGTEGGIDWDHAWPGFTGWKRRLNVTGAGHLSFEDKPWIIDGFGVRDHIPPDEAALQYGTLTGVRAATITRAYVAAFFDRHLRATPDPLLDGPSPIYPEVTFAA
ncbi:alpha/beta hydrolase family protein [Embleya sp. AB8]|uniref:alpha/beta hydrolase family protein n=1 Tax=Embleya sp. AB8 TaxID=3156304 RepID=UPI003C712637